MYSICSADLNWFLVDTVEVNSCEGSAVVANNDTIWIHHWYKLEDIVTAETLYGRWKGEGRGSRGERIPIKRARILCTIKYCDILCCIQLVIVINFRSGYFTYVITAHY